jgi:hypothetical protein
MVGSRPFSRIVSTTIVFQASGDDKRWGPGGRFQTVGGRLSGTARDSLDAAFDNDEQGIENRKRSMIISDTFVDLVDASLAKIRSLPIVDQLIRTRARA